MLAGIEDVVKRIRAKYCMRKDARDKMHAGSRAQSWITVNHTPVPIGKDGQLQGKVGEKIESSSAKAPGPGPLELSEDHKDRFADIIRNRNVANSSDLADRVQKGKIRLRLLRKRQNKHIAGTTEYNDAVASGKYPSELQLSNRKQRDFVVKALQNGEYVLRKDGSIRIYYDYGSKIGNACNEDGSDRNDTSCGELHMSKDGLHIVPVPRRDS